METNNYKDEIDLKELFKEIWLKKYVILIFTAISSIISLYYSLSIPNFYTSSALLAPISKDESLSTQLGQYSSIASLAGIGLGSDVNTKNQEAIERIQSYNFFKNQFLPYIKLENLMAVDEWIPEKNKIIYEDKLFDSDTSKWVISKDGQKSQEPSYQDAYFVYKNIIDIISARGFVTISIQHQSPHIAKKWVDLIVLNINESMRLLDINSAKKSIDFLNDLSSKTNVQSIKEVILKLLETQMQTLMLASSNDAYVFKIIDSPIVPEKKSGPQRKFILIIGTILGGLTSIIIVSLINVRRSIKD